MFHDQLLLTAEMERECQEREATEKALCDKPYCHTFPEKTRQRKGGHTQGKKHRWPPQITTYV